MPLEEKKDPFKPVRSMFISKTVTKMRDIKDVNPTQIAKALGINHSRYLLKLQKPGEFSFKHIWRLSELLEIDVQQIIDIIKTEMAGSSRSRKKQN